MADNPFGTWTTNVRFEVRQAWKKSRANLVMKGIDILFTALSKVINPNTPDAIKGDWQDPLFFTNTDQTVWEAQWLDATNQCRRSKIGGSQAAATPANETDGEKVQTAATGSGPPPGFPA